MFADGNEKLYDFNKRSDEAGLLCTDPSLTVQADAVDADINVIVERYGLTGKLPDNFRLPTYQDYDEVFDFATAQRAMMDGATEFMKIPAPIRALFENDPGHFYQFAIDPDNFDKLVEMGLAKKAEPIQTAEAAIPSTPGAAPAVAPPATPAAPATPTTWGLKMVDQNILALIRRLETTLARQRSMVLATEAQLAAAVAIKDAQNELPLPAGSGPAKRSGT